MFTLLGENTVVIARKDGLSLHRFDPLEDGFSEHTRKLGLPWNFAEDVFVLRAFSQPQKSGPISVEADWHEWLEHDPAFLPDPECAIVLLQLTIRSARAPDARTNVVIATRIEALLELAAEEEASPDVTVPWNDWAPEHARILHLESDGSEELVLNPAAAFGARGVVAPRGRTHGRLVVLDFGSAALRPAASGPEWTVEEHHGAEETVLPASLLKTQDDGGGEGPVLAGARSELPCRVRTREFVAPHVWGETRRPDAQYDYQAGIWENGVMMHVSGVLISWLDRRCTGRPCADLVHAALQMHAWNGRSLQAVLTLPSA